MTQHYVIRRTSDRLLWAGGYVWTTNPMAARWFSSETEAEETGIREIETDRSTWFVEPLSLDGNEAA